MQYKIFTVPVRNSNLMEEHLNSFLRGHRISHVSKQLIQEEDTSYWSFCVEYLVDNSPEKNANQKRGRIDYKEVLNQDDFRLFSLLREWRKNEAEKENIPVYTIFTNEHLAKIAQNRCRNKADLAKISGIGQAKIEKYSEDVLNRVESFKNEAD